jgi:hypothetical protein
MVNGSWFMVKKIKQLKEKITYGFKYHLIHRKNQEDFGLFFGDCRGNSCPLGSKWKFPLQKMNRQDACSTSHKSKGRTMSCPYKRIKRAKGYLTLYSVYSAFGGLFAFFTYAGNSINWSSYPS